MEAPDENLKLEIWFIDLAIRKAFSDHDIKIDDITWNPHRVGMASDKFNIHAIQVTVGPWRDILYRIESGDIKNYGLASCCPSAKICSRRCSWCAGCPPGQAPV